MYELHIKYYVLCNIVKYVVEHTGMITLYLIIKCVFYYFTIYW